MEALKFVLDKGVDVNMVNSSGEYAITLGAACMYIKKIKKIKKIILFILIIYVKERLFTISQFLK